MVYGIHRTGGTWTSPNYQQLRLAWDTGIVLYPGTAYGKSYVDIQGGGLRVTAGNVGIGTTAPAQKLMVVGPNNAGKDPDSGMSYGGQLAIKGNAPQLDFIDTDHNDWSIHVNDNRMYFIRQPWNHTDLVLDGAGNVGIGITTPGAKLHVNGTIRSPMWNVTQVFDRKEGGLPVTATFNSGGGTLIVFVSGTAYRSSTGLFSLVITIDDDNNRRQFIDLYTNEGNSHKTIPSTALVFYGYSAGTHTQDCRMDEWNTVGL